MRRHLQGPDAHKLQYRIRRCGVTGQPLAHRPTRSQAELAAQRLAAQAKSGLKGEEFCVWDEFFHVS